MKLQVVGMFILRVVLGVIFIAHGWAKVSGMEGTVGFFASIGLPAFLAYVVAYIEFLGGIALVLGVFTRVAGYLIALVMAGAIITVKFKAGFMGGYEFDLILLAAALAVAFAGAGPWSVSGKVCGCGDCVGCGTRAWCGKKAVSEATPKA